MIKGCWTKLIRKIQKVLQPSTSTDPPGKELWARNWLLLRVTSTGFHLERREVLRKRELEILSASLRIDLCTCRANSSKYCCGFSGFSFIISKPDALIRDGEVVVVNLTVFSGV